MAMPTAINWNVSFIQAFRPNKSSRTPIKKMMEMEISNPKRGGVRSKNIKNGITKARKIAIPPKRGMAL